MNIQYLNTYIKRALSFALVATAMAVATSCDSIIYDEEGDCTPHYKVSFRFARNILNADAFGSQVTDVSLYLFHADGSLAYSTKQQRELTEDNNYYIDVDVAPGTYDMVAWCAGESPIDGHTAFVVGGGDKPTAMTELTATLPIEVNADGLNVSSHDISRLYHGYKKAVVFPKSYGDIKIDPVMLTKDTNHLTLQLVNSDGSAIDPANISVQIEGKHTVLDHTNMPANSRAFAFRPWAVKGLETTEDAATARDSGLPNGVQVELTTGRLMADVPQMLTVHRIDTGKKIIEIPLIEYLLLVRSEYEAATSDQDYLDRYDDYSMTFFMQEGYTWIKSRIIINGWRVVPPQTGEII